MNGPGPVLSVVVPVHDEEASLEADGAMSGAAGSSPAAAAFSGAGAMGAMSGR